MIDGIKTACLSLNVVPLADELGVSLNGQTVYVKESGLIFGFDQRVDTTTGELHNVCTLRGSLHKYKNLGAHNADRFYMSDLCDVLYELRDRYLINPITTQLYSVEFGVNLHLPYSPQRVINAIRMHKNKVFAPMGKVGLIYETALYDLKIYDKGKQSGLSEYENILRIEIKATGKHLKSKYKGLVILRLSDLLEVGLWECFESLLLKAIDDTMIVEAIPDNQLTKKEQNIFDLFTGNDWQKLDRKNLYKKKQRLKELASRTGAFHLKEQVREMVANECKILRNGDKRRLFGIGTIEEEVNLTDKLNNSNIGKQATNDGFSMTVKKYQKGDKRRIKIKALNVATDITKTELNQIKENPTSVTLKKSDTTKHPVKIRGKPPDRKNKTNL